MKSKKPIAHGTLAWTVTLTSSLFFFYSFIQILVPNAINVQLMQTFSLDAVGLGWLVSMYFWANALFLFPAGNLLDRYSTKKLVLVAIAFCIAGTFLFAVAPTAILAAAGRFLVGLGGSFCFLSSVRLASRWFPPNRMALVTGIIVTMAMIGGFVSQSPMVFLTDWSGWRHAMLFNVALGVVIFIAIALVVQDRPPNSDEKEKADKAHLQSLGFWRCMKLVLLNPNNWLGGIYTSLLNLPVFLLGGLWGMRYLVQAHNLTELHASYATSAMFVGVIFGSPIFGWFSDHIGRRCMPMIFGAVTSLVVILVLMYLPNLSLTSLIALFFLMGFVTSSQVLSYPTIAELNPIALTGTAVSVASATIMFSGVIFQPFFGKMLEWNWDHTMVNNTPVYSLHDFNTAMWIMPIGFIISLIIAFMIRETYCEAQV
ncbi:MAG: MFS transporter [Gammaproteobacteria bacterium]|nr:MFS transporter [Gammaproteobacteria bacterium]